MGFLDKLWDETLAGPAPDSGLGKLRKYNSFSGVRSSSVMNNVSPADHLINPNSSSSSVSRSITILRSNADHHASSVSAPASPAPTSTPTSPFSPASTPRGGFKMITRRKMTPENTDPVVYDWIVINALDR